MRFGIWDHGFGIQELGFGIHIWGPLNQIGVEQLSMRLCPSFGNTNLRSILFPWQGKIIMWFGSLTDQLFCVNGQFMFSNWTSYITILYKCEQKLLSILSQNEQSELYVYCIGSNHNNSTSNYLLSKLQPISLVLHNKVSSQILSNLKYQIFITI